MKRFHIFFGCWRALVAALPLFGLLLTGRAATPIISEIVPDSAHTLADEDGDYPDWIELFNPGPGSVNLQGWYLTDNAVIRTNWAFPSVTLPANSYLVVFASGKNRTNDPAHLHTSFQLEASGEYLALVQPDGVTIASAFSPAFPAVKEDVAFGVAQSQVMTTLLNASVPRILVPLSAVDLPPNWNLISYVPGAGWSTGVTPTAVGFDTNQAAGLPSNVAPSGTAVQSTGYNGNTYPANLAIDGNLVNFTHTASTDTAPFWQLTLTNEMAIHEIVVFNRGGGCCQWRLRDITVEILTTNLSGSVTNWKSPLLNPENVLNNPAYLSNNLVALTGSPVIGRTVIVRRTFDPDNSGAGTGTAQDDQNVLSLGEVRVMASGAPGLRPYFTTDIQAQMWNQNASAFIRLPFVSTNTPDILRLTTRYDDGFIAYLNGTEVARRNAPASPQWDSTATADRPLTNAVQQEIIDVSGGIAALVNGPNLFAIQLLNSSASDGNALFQAELTATRQVITTNVFFNFATPGTANTGDWYFDEVKDTHFSVDRGFFTNAFSVAITNATPGSQIYYSFNSDEPGPTKGFLYTSPISITNTTVLRARAYLPNWKPTDVDTVTYLFLGDVIYQGSNWTSTASTPPPYFPATWGGNTVNYGMDPRVVTNYSQAQWYEALTQIPTISIVTEMPNLFDASIGIYANASQQGELWERPASIELIDPHQANPDQFQKNCGLRIRGGFSRNAQFPRHALRVFFRKEYGSGKLNYPLFEDEGADEFETFDLRNSSNYAWWRENPTGTNDTFVREVWCRETLGAMGQPYRRSRYYHLYLNGQYWGISETDERPEASYGQTYFGGSKTNFDVVKCGNRGTEPDFITEATDGNLIAWSNLWVLTRQVWTNAANSNYFRVLGQNPDGTRDPAQPVMLDVDNLIDYMLEIFYSGDGDATLSAFLANNQPNNWFGMRDRANPDVGFRFFNSDCEHTLGANSSQVDRTGPWGGSNEGIFMWSNPQWMHEALMRNAEYRVRFGDHVQKHFFNGGALTFEQCTNRWWRRAGHITKAIRAYSARWGDVVRPTPPYGESDWTNTLNWVANSWFPPRANLVLAQLTNDLLFPTIAAPTLSSYGGFVTPGFSLTMTQTNPAGTIYYTLDGTDPRLIGGAISGTAVAYSGTITVQDNVSLRTRVRVGTNWSAAIEAVFTTAQYFRDLALTEIMFNPVGATNVDGDEFEFLELKNTGGTQLNLSGLSFSSGITFTFTNGTRLSPGAFFVLGRNKAQLQARYPGLLVNGVYAGRLANEGETLTVRHSVGGQVFAVSYGDGSEWPQAADGHGFSLVPAGTNFNSDLPRHWRASASAGGSPGAEDPTPGIPGVVINEALTHSSLSPEFIELYNPAGSAAPIGGWFLTDDPAFPKKFRIANGTTIPAGQFAVLNESAFNPTPGLGNSFTLSAEGERIFLFSGDAATNLTGYSHGFAFGAAAEGVTFGRHIISTGEDHFVAQLSPTSGGANAGPRLSDVVISEIQYNPRTGQDAFVEIRNRTGASVPLYDPANPTNTWRLNGADFVLPPGISLAANGVALFVGIDPALFRARYNVAANVQVFGPYGGSLQNDGELIELQRLDARGTNNVAWVTLDAVRYNDRAPWPTAADGAGASLHRLNLAAYGNDPVNWAAAAPTPGGPFAGGAAPVFTTQPASQFVLASASAMFSVAVSPASTYNYQWRFNGTNVLDATNSTFVINNVQPSHAGPYNVVVFGAAGSAESTNAVLTVGIPASITEQPANAFVWVPPDTRATNRVATFRVTASSLNPPLSYRWRFNGVDLNPELPNVTGVTSNSLTLTNVSLADGGDYDCSVTDALGTVHSAVAKLVPIITPRIIQTSATNLSVAAGSTFTIGATIFGSPPPFTFVWRSNSLVVRTNLSSSTNDFVTLRVPTNAITFNHRLEVTNFSATLITGTNRIFYATTVLADSDNDGLPDIYEAGFPGGQLNPGDDLDNDRMSNLDEYLAGTDPLDPASYLRIDFAVPNHPSLLTFGAVSNRTYTLQYSPNVIGGPWSNLAHVVSQPTNHLELLFDPSAAGQRFYRVVTPRQP